MKIHKLGEGSDFRTLVVTCNGKTVKRYEKCHCQYAIQHDCGIETEGFIITENGVETFYPRPNVYEAWC